MKKAYSLALIAMLITTALATGCTNNRSNTVDSAASDSISASTTDRMTDKADTSDSSDDEKTNATDNAVIDVGKKGLNSFVTLNIDDMLKYTNINISYAFSSGKVYSDDEVKTAIESIKANMTSTIDAGTTIFDSKLTIKQADPKEISEINELFHNAGFLDYYKINNARIFDDYQITDGYVLLYDKITDADYANSLNNYVLKINNEWVYDTCITQAIMTYNSNT